MKRQFPTKPINRIKQIEYRVIVRMTNNREIEFTFTEMNHMVKMYKDFKKQSGFRSLSD